MSSIPLPITPAVGDLVSYWPPTSTVTVRARVVKLGRQRGYVLAQLDNGSWCYVHDIEEIVERAR